MKYDAAIQVPVPADFKARVQDAAELDDRPVASFARVALERYCRIVEVDARIRETDRRNATALGGKAPEIIHRDDSRDPWAIRVRSWDAVADESQPATVARLHSLADDARRAAEEADGVEDQDCPECDAAEIFGGVDEQDCPTCGGAARINEGVAE